MYSPPCCPVYTYISPSYKRLYYNSTNYIFYIKTRPDDQNILYINIFTKLYIITGHTRQTIQTR